MPAPSPQSELAAAVREYYDDPLGYVMFAFPWGKAGTRLAPFTEPDIWQCEFLEWLGDEIKARAFNGVDAVRPIRAAVSSGHGIGKGALTGMLVNFLMSTRSNMRGTVTANTSGQLQDKTWAAIATWHKLSITRPWFEINTNIMYALGARSEWKCTPIACDPDNADSFQGQHAADSTSLYIFDEASNIDERIFDAADPGGLTDGEPWFLMFGNPTRRSGRFYDIVFGDKGGKFKTWIIDARTCKFPNKEEIADQEAEWGEDSDRFRVRVRGLPPNASDAQFIDSQRVRDAQKRTVAVLPDEPLVAGCDLAWGGSDSNVIRFRRGRDARGIPAIRIPGELTRDPAVLTNRLADVLTGTYGGQKVAMLFLDSAGIAGPIAARLRDLGHKNVQEVNFGADSPNPKMRYFRDFMWSEMKDWLLTGAIDATPRLETDLCGPGLREDPKQRIWLESKKDMKRRDISSPDDADALALTFARKVAVAAPPVVVAPRMKSTWG